MKIGFNPNDYIPEKIEGDAVWGGTSVNKNLTSSLYKDDDDAYIFIESVVQLTQSWTPPMGELDGDPGPITLQPGDLVCTYLAHGSPKTDDEAKYDFKVKLQGQIAGVAYNSNFNPENGLFAAEGATYPVANSLELEDDEWEIKPDLDPDDPDEFKGNDLKTTLGDYDQIRFFVKCG